MEDEQQQSYDRLKPLRRPRTLDECDVPLNENQARDSTAKENDAIGENHKSVSSNFILNVAAGLDGCDDQLLPASFRVMEAELGFHPAVLGHITFAQIVASSVSCPLWGYIADRYSRKYLMSLGLMSWGAATIGLGFVSSLRDVVLLRIINGVFLGCIGPISQSILADTCSTTTRGYYFGIIQMCASGGRVIGGVVMTSVAFLPLYGYKSWRWTFMLVGILSCFMGLVTAILFPDYKRSQYHELSLSVPIQQSLASEDELKPIKSHTEKEALQSVYGTEQHRETDVNTGEAEVAHESSSAAKITEPVPYPMSSVNHVLHGDQRSTHSTLLNKLSDNMDPPGRVPHHHGPVFMKYILKSNFGRPSILLLLLEGIIGMVSWSALAFLTLYFQYRGLSDVQAGIASCFLHIGAMLAGPLAGTYGDYMAELNPFHGRLLLAQLSMLLRVPLSILTFVILPTFPNNFFGYTLDCFFLGICCVGGVVVNRPLLSELVLPAHRATVFSIIIAVEGALGSLIGVLLMGFLTESVFNYVRTDHFLLQDLPAATKSNNAEALGYSLLILTCVTWILSCICYSLIRYFYESDMKPVQKFYTYCDQRLCKQATEALPLSPIVSLTDSIRLQRQQYQPSLPDAFSTSIMY